MVNARIIFDEGGAGGSGGFSSPNSGSIGKGGSGGLGGIGKVVGVLGVIAGGIAILAQASQFLKGILGGIMKVLMLILKPIGDLLGVALLPILYILKPIGLFFNMLMRPYIQKAMEAMRLGGQFMAEGQFDKATESFALGFAYLMKPLFDLFVNFFTEMYALLAEALHMPGIAERIRDFGNSTIATTDSWLDKWYDSLVADFEHLKETQRILEGDFVSPEIKNELQNLIDRFSLFSPAVRAAVNSIDELLNKLTGIPEDVMTGESRGIGKVEAPFVTMGKEILAEQTGGIGGMSILTDDTLIMWEKANAAAEENKSWIEKIKDFNMKDYFKKVTDAVSLLVTGPDGIIKMKERTKEADDKFTTLSDNLKGPFWESLLTSSTWVRTLRDSLWELTKDTYVIKITERVKREYV